MPSHYSNMLKKSQAFYVDFLIGLFVLIAITFVFTRVIIDVNAREDNFQELINDGMAITNSFVSPGYNRNAWDDDPPKGRLGFVKDGKIIKDDFDAFLNLLNTGNYEKTKALLGTKNDYVMYFEFNNNKLEYSGRTVYGKYVNINSVNADNVIKITRVVYYNLDGRGKIADMIIIVF